MNELEVTLRLRYDDDGTVVGYELSASPTGEPASITISSIDDPPNPCIRAAGVVTTKLIAAINTAFNLPPIPGMAR